MWYNIIKERKATKMKKPKLNENTVKKIETFGYAECGNNYYELKNYIDAKGKCYTVLEWTNLRTGDAKQFDWEKCTKEA